MIRTLILAAVLALGACSSVSARPVPVRDALARTATDRLLDVRLRNDTAVRGFPRIVAPDTLWMQPQEPTGAPLVGVPLAAVVGVDEWRSRANRGATIGAVSAGVVGGSFGALLAAAMAGLGGNDEPVGPAIAGFIIGGGLGAGVGGLLGAGVGSFSYAWQPVWPVDSLPYQPPADGGDAFSDRWSPHGSRFGLMAGGAASLGEDENTSGLAFRVGLRRDAGRNLSIGPEISWADLGATITDAGPDHTTYLDRSGVTDVSVTTVLRSPQPGVRPYADIGLGMYLSGDAYFGGHVGGGLQRRTASGSDFLLDVRYHFSISNVPESEVDSFVTAGLGFGFAL